jgi:hypothetical protein
MGTNRAAGRSLAGLALLVVMPLLAGRASAAPPAGPEVCVIAPRTEADRSGPALASVPLSRPTIFVREPLAQVRLLRGSTVLWERQAGLEGPIQGPIAWPLPPLRPGESVRLLLQPSGSGPTAFAEVLLRSADGATLRRTDTLVASLRANPDAWQGAVERALVRGDGALATALLFAFEGPSAPALDALRLEAFQHSCRQEPPP